MTSDKRAKITDLHRQEAAKLKALWDSKPHPTQAVFGETFGLGNQANVGHYLNGRSAINLKAARAFAEVLGCEIADFSPRVAKELADLTSEINFSIVDVPLSKAVPLISWVTAGTWADVSDPFQPGEAEEWLPCPVRHSPLTYAVRVRGDSMYAPGSRPSYSDGDIIFVDPQREAKHGDRVIVRMDDQAEATFKQLLIEDGRKLLKALNPEWAPRYIEIDGNATITGVVIGKWVPE